jgi:hypothetical protein
MFDTIFGNKKPAEIEMRDLEKFRSIPSLALPAICALDDYLTNDMMVFEWGSGASTLFFAQRCGDWASVEHSPIWHEKVTTALTYRGLQHRDSRYSLYPIGNHLIEPEEGFDPDFASFQPGFATVNFRGYVEFINQFSDDYFDVILVDGRARCACLKLALSKVKTGGILLLDDSARSIYQCAMSEIEWPHRHFEGCIPYYRHGHTVRTTLWVKEGEGV